MTHLFIFSVTISISWLNLWFQGFSLMDFRLFSQKKPNNQKRHKSQFLLWELHQQLPLWTPCQKSQERMNWYSMLSHKFFLFEIKTRLKNISHFSLQGCPTVIVLQFQYALMTDLHQWCTVGWARMPTWHIYFYFFHNNFNFLLILWFQSFSNEYPIYVKKSINAR